MKVDKVFNRFKFKMFLNSIINSLIYGLINGFTISLVATIILYICKIKNIGLTFAIFGVVAILFSVFSYFKFFKVTQESIAKTLDDLGLDERVITMLEYKNEDNDIVTLQRTDALNKLSNVNPNEIKIKIQKTPIIVLCVLLLIFSGSLFLPKPSADTGNEPPEVIIPSEEDTIIKELLEKLREIIDKAEIEYELFPTNSSEVISIIIFP